MYRLFIRHDVADYAAWRGVYDQFDAKRRAMGVTAHAVYQCVDDPGDVTVWHDFADQQQAEAFAKSEALQAAMKKAGVRGMPTTWLTSEGGST